MLAVAVPQNFKQYKAKSALGGPNQTSSHKEKSFKELFTEKPLQLFK